MPVAYCEEIALGQIAVLAIGFAVLAAGVVGIAWIIQVPFGARSTAERAIAMVLAVGAWMVVGVVGLNALVGSMGCGDFRLFG